MKRAPALVLAFCTAAVLSGKTFAAEPVLFMGFEAAEDVRRLDVSPGVRAEWAREHATEGASACKLTFSAYGASESDWPSAALRFKPPLDWSGYRAVTVDVFNPQAAPAEIGIRFADQVGYAAVPPGQEKTISIDLADADNPVDNFGFLMRLRAAMPQKPTVFYVDNVRLLPRTAQDADAFELRVAPPVQRGGGILASIPTDKVSLKFFVRLGPKEEQGLQVRAQLGNEVRTSAVHGGMAQMDLPCPKGDATLVAEAVNREGKVIWRREQPIRHLPPASDEVGLDERGICRVNGKPFFPLGIYNPPIQDYELLKRMGFNCVGPYIEATDKQVAAEARRAGLRILSDAAEEAGESVYGAKPADVGRFVKEAKDCGVLLGYYLFDEPSPPAVTREELSARSDVVKANDPYHLATGCNNDWQKYYAGACEAMIVDAYPIPNLDSCIPRLKTTQKATEGVCPWWDAPQCFGWEAYCEIGDPGPTDKTGRPPTYDELRAQCWAGICLGAKGITFYSAQVQGFPTRFGWPIMWKGLEATVSELAALEDVLLAPEIPVGADSETAFAAGRNWNGTIFVAVVNLGESTRRVNLTGVPAERLICLEGKENLTAEGGKFKVTLPGRTARLYASRPLGIALPDVAATRERLSALQAERDRLNALDVARYEAGADVEMSWGVPPGKIREVVWRRMIDGYRGTPWVVGDTGLGSPLTGGGFAWPAEKIKRGERWIDVRLAKPASVERIVVVSANAQLEVLAGQGTDLHPVAVQTAKSGEYAYEEVDVTTGELSPAREIGRVRLRFTRDAVAGRPEMIYEIEAYRKP